MSATKPSQSKELILDSGRSAIPKSVRQERIAELGQAKGGGVVALGLNPPGDPVARAEAGLPLPDNAVIFAPRIEAATNVREVLERIAKTGTVLVVHGGRLVASPPGGRWPRGVLGAVTALEPLIVGILSGDPVACAFRHEAPVEAVTLLAPSCPSCAEHAA